VGGVGTGVVGAGVGAEVVGVEVGEPVGAIYTQQHATPCAYGLELFPQPGGPPGWL